MILDSSAIVAIVMGEREGPALARAVEGAGDVRISAATYLETSVVLGPEVHEEFDAWLSAAGASIASFDAAQAVVARQAYASFGRGSGSKARLNLGDCFSYALATVLGQPLLFTGRDFVHTDVTPAYLP